MITDKIKIDSQGAGMEDALREVEKFCEYKHFTHAQTLRMRLLAEETISMIRELSNDFTGEFWASGEGETCSLNVEGRALMTDDRRDALMDVSSSGKNLLAKGVLGKIAAFFDRGLSQVPYAPGTGVMDYGLMSADLAYAADQTYANGAMWSLRQYRSGVKAAYAAGEAEMLGEAWDELQKSIVANVADDVQVGVLGGKVRMVVSKRFAE